jgi:hypothetical protein
MGGASFMLVDLLTIFHFISILGKSTMRIAAENRISANWPSSGFQTALARD